MQPGERDIDIKLAVAHRRESRQGLIEPQRSGIGILQIDRPRSRHPRRTLGISRDHRRQVAVAATHLDRVRLPVGSEERREIRRQRQTVRKRTALDRKVALDLDATEGPRGHHGHHELAVAGEGRHRHFRIQCLA